MDLSDSATLNLIARPQDFYYIARRISYPGQKVFQPGIRLVQAILAAGGLARDNEVKISREGLNGRLAITKFNLKRSLPLNQAHRSK
jgi:hypothetical protein